MTYAEADRLITKREEEQKALKAPPVTAFLYVASVLCVAFAATLLSSPLVAVGTAVVALLLWAIGYVAHKLKQIERHLRPLHYSPPTLFRQGQTPPE